MVGVLILVVIIAVAFAYQSWLTKGIRKREIRTSLPPERVREIFDAKIARAGWKIIDDGNPRVAQSSLAAGIRQQISMRTEVSDGGTTVHVAPTRVVKKLLGQPTKAHTLRIRLNSFTAAVRSADPSARVA